MAWNPYTDQKNRAYSGILKTLFPEQTKTLPRIIAWSIVFLLDLTVIVGGAVYFGWLKFENYRTQNELRLAAGGLIAAVFGIFWLQGYLWYAIVNAIRKSRELD